MQTHKPAHSWLILPMLAKAITQQSRLSADLEGGGKAWMLGSD